MPENDALYTAVIDTFLLEWKSEMLWANSEIYYAYILIENTDLYQNINHVEQWLTWWQRPDSAITENEFAEWQDQGTNLRKIVDKKKLKWFLLTDKSDVENRRKAFSFSRHSCWLCWTD